MKKAVKLLLATRAMESPPYEGGFVLLSDIARALAENDKDFELAMFSSKRVSSHKNIRAEKIFAATGWGRISKIQFPIGMRRSAGRYDLVHTAHIPTFKNVRLLKKALAKAEASGTKTVQTITGLPKVSDKDLPKLLWGDILVCQSPSVQNRIRTVTGKPAKLVVPWPSPLRVAFDLQRQQDTRKEFIDSNDKKIVVFPGEFERMGIGEDFAQCLSAFFKKIPDSLVVLACRFDTLKIGEKLTRKFPGKVISVGQTEKIIELLEAADLVVFPTRKMDEKFHPPLIITEALSLGRPTLISDKIDLEPSVSSLLKRSVSDTGWKTFAEDMAYACTKIKPSPTTTSNNFDKMIKAYKEIYSEVTADISKQS